MKQEKQSKPSKQSEQAIPKILHCIWIGDDSKRPDKLLKTWQDKHPDWEYRLWGNKELYGRKWRKQGIINEYLREQRFAGVADVMRYNILLEQGGFLHPADSLCLHNVEPLLKDCTALAVYENETVRPGLISPLYACTVHHPLVEAILERLPDMPPRVRQAGRPAANKAPWQVTGNAHMRTVIESQKWEGLTVVPSYRFNPVHHTGHTYTGRGKIYAQQLWGSTFDKYGEL